MLARSITKKLIIFFIAALSWQQCVKHTANSVSYKKIIKTLYSVPKHFPQISLNKKEKIVQRPVFQEVFETLCPDFRTEFLMTSKNYSDLLHKGAFSIEVSSDVSNDNAHKEERAVKVTSIIHYLEMRLHRALKHTHAYPKQCLNSIIYFLHQYDIYHLRYSKEQDFSIFSGTKKQKMLEGLEKSPFHDCSYLWNHKHLIDHIILTIYESLQNELDINEDLKEENNRLGEQSLASFLPMTNCIISEDHNLFFVYPERAATLAEVQRGCNTRLLDLSLNKRLLVYLGLLYQTHVLQEKGWIHCNINPASVYIDWLNFEHFTLGDFSHAKKDYCNWKDSNPFSSPELHFYEGPTDKMEDVEFKNDHSEESSREQFYNFGEPQWKKIDVFSLGMTLLSMEVTPAKFEKVRKHYAEILASEHEEHTKFDINDKLARFYIDPDYNEIELSKKVEKEENFFEIKAREVILNYLSNMILFDYKKRLPLKVHIYLLNNLINSIENKNEEGLIKIGDLLDKEDLNKIEEEIGKPSLMENVRTKLKPNDDEILRLI